MDSFRRSRRTASPANDLAQLSNVSSPVTPLLSYGRQSAMPGTPVLSTSNSPIPTTPEDSRSNGKPSGMRGGMSQFRAQPVYSKQKLRVKQYDPTKRNYIARSDDETDKKMRSGMTEPSRQNDNTERSQERTTGQQTTGGHNGDELTEALPLQGITISPTGSGAPPTTQTAEDFTPERLAGIVSFSITKCREKRMTTLGLAIKRLWQDSHEDPRLAHVLGSVLSQTATEDEKSELQDRIAAYKIIAKTEIEEHKAKNYAPLSMTPPESSKTPSHTGSTPDDNTKQNDKSPARRTRASARRSTVNTMKVEEDEWKAQTPTVNGKRSRTQASIADDSTSKRQKRSDSVSSGSSLSSVPSNVDQDVDMSDAQTATRSSAKKIIALQLAKQDPKSKGPPKKLPGVLDAPRINGKTINTADEPSSIARKQKKAELTRKFDHVKVNGSNIRAPLKPVSSQSNDDYNNAMLIDSSVNFRGKKKEFDDLESIASSTQEDLLVPPPPEARRSSRSRQATPNAQRTRVQSARVQARIKISPQKQGTGVAGIASRSSRSKEISVEQSDDDDDERENNDFCSACGANGRLLCCDGCIRAFHFMCLDPPMQEDAPPEGLWFCFNCEAKKDPYNRARRGIFSLMKSNLRKANTSAYSLPKHTREYYEGVGTGDDGEYVDEAISGKTKNVKVPGYDEEKKQDNTKLTNKKGEAILCFSCGGSAVGKREIIPCDYCGLYWHLDCLNPPLANPPFRDPQNRAKYRWMCPAHADSVINAAGPGGRLYKTRRPRNARIVDTQLCRGFKSNGIVEIQLEDSAEESEIDDEPPIFRISERAVRLDFNDRLRRDKEEALRRQAVLKRLQEEDQRNAKDSIQAYRAKSCIEKQAISSLVELTKASTNPSLEPDEIKEVIDALLVAAPNNVLALLDPQSADGPMSDQRLTNSKGSAPKELEARQLILLRELISEKLAKLGHIC